MNFAVIALIMLQTMFLQALTPRQVRQRSDEFTKILQSPTPDTGRAQVILNELRAAKEQSTAIKLDRDLQAYLAQQQPTRTEIIPAETVVVEVPAGQSGEVTALKQQLADKVQETTQLKAEAERVKTEHARLLADLEKTRKEMHEVAHRIKQLSLQVLDAVNATDASLGQLQNVTQGDERTTETLGNITQRYDAMRNLRNELLGIALPA